MNEVVKNIVWLFGILGVQLFILDAIDLGIYSTYFSPIILSFILLKKPLGTTIFQLLIYAFVAGMIIDLFRNTVGLNASVLLLIAILRSKFLYLISSRDDFELDVELNLITLGAVRFLLFFGLTIFFHHLMFFLLEQFSFVNFFQLVLRSIINSAWALLILVFIQYLVIPKK